MKKDFFNICKKCGGRCCKIGGADLSEKEAKLILEKFPNVKLKKINPNHYWTLARNGKCFFLNKNNSCRIYAVRPIQCRCFPISINKSKKGYEIYSCPLYKHLSNKQIWGMKKIAKKVPSDIFKNYWKKAGISKSQLSLIKKRMKKIKNFGK